MIRPRIERILGRIGFVLFAAFALAFVLWGVLSQQAPQSPTQNPNTYGQAQPAVPQRTPGITGQQPGTTVGESERDANQRNLEIQERIGTATVFMAVIAFVQALVGIGAFIVTLKAANAAESAARAALLQANVMRTAHQQHLTMKNMTAYLRGVPSKPPAFEVVVECEVTNTTAMNVTLERVDTFGFGLKGNHGFNSAGGRLLVPSESYPISRSYGVTAEEVARRQIHEYFIGVIRFIDAFENRQNQRFGWAIKGDGGNNFTFEPAFGRIIDDTIRRGEDEVRAKQKKDKAEGRLSAATMMRDLD